MSVKRQYALLLAIFFIAVILRYIALNQRNIQYDDAFSYFLSVRSLPEIIQGTAADTMPPLYYFLLHFWMMISNQLWFLRLMSVLLTLGSGYFLYLLVSEFAGTKAGLWSALFAAISPMQIYHAQDLRMYALLEFCQLGFALCLVKVWKSEQGHTGIPWGWWIGVVLFGASAMYSHNLAVFGLIAPNFYLLIKRDWKHLWKLLLAQGVIGMLALPWLFLLPGQLEKVQHAFWTPKPGLVEVIQAILMWFVNLPLNGIWMILGAVVSVQIFVLVLLELWRGRKFKPGNGYLLAWAFVPPLLLFITSYLIRPVFVPRGFLASSMAFYGLAGAVAARRGAIGKWIGGSVILAAALSMPFFYTYAEFPRSPFLEANNMLEQSAQPGDVIIHDNKLSYFPSHFYSPTLPQVFLPDEPGSSNDTYAPASQQAMQIIPTPDLQTAVGRADVVYYVVFTKAVEEYRAAGNKGHPSLRWLESQFQKSKETSFNDLLVIRYER